MSNKSEVGLLPEGIHEGKIVAIDFMPSKNRAGVFFMQAKIKIKDDHYWCVLATAYYSSIALLRMTIPHLLGHNYQFKCKHRDIPYEEETKMAHLELVPHQKLGVIPNFAS